MKVFADTDLCEAKQICMQSCPEVFQREEDDMLTIQLAEIPQRLRASVQKAVERCPRRALRIEA